MKQQDIWVQLMKEIYNIVENITLIIVTHRHKSVSNCDKIYLLDNGKIIDEGKFADLEKRHSLCFIVKGLSKFIQRKK